MMAVYGPSFMRGEPSKEDALFLGAWTCAMGASGCDMTYCAYSYCQKPDGSFGAYHECEGWDPEKGMPKEKPAAPAATTKYEAVSKEPEPVKEETDPVKDEAKEALLADEAPESPLTEPMVPVQTREPDPLKPTLLGDKEPEAVANAKAAPQGPQIPELANVEDKAVVRKENIC
eukprot:g7875.t1